MKNIILASFLVIGCKGALKEYYKQMEDFGFIAYTTPLQYSGTGTLVGGTPERLVVASVPETCFPDEYEGKDTGIRFVEETSLPSKYKDIEVSTGFTTDFLKIIGAGSPPISAGAKFSIVKSLDVSFEGAKIEILDTVKLQTYYSKMLHEDCKVLLERFGVIIAALRIDKMTIKFYGENNGDINLKSDGTVDSLLKFGAGVKWDVINESKLLIDSPKYIAYRIARLQRQDGGVAMYRASRLKRGKYVFEDVGLFPDIAGGKGLDGKVRKQGSIGKGTHITGVEILSF